MAWELRWREHAFSSEGGSSLEQTKIKTQIAGFMNKLKYILALALIGAFTGLGTSQSLAQDEQGGRPRRGGGERGERPNFDPEQMRQRMMDRYKEMLGVKDDAEWKLISERIEKVNEARRAVGAGGMGGMMFNRPGGGPRGGGFGQSSPEAEALQKAIESNASSQEIKTALEKYRNARKEKEASLEKAQDELRKVLSVKQEAAAVLAGLLK